MTAQRGDKQHVVWPAERFYWTVLDAPGWTRNGLAPEGLRQLIEDDIPLPPSDLAVLHAVCAPLGMGDGRVLICALPRPALAGLGREVLTLCPACAPADVAPGLVTGGLNLLVGPLEPDVLRRRRRLRHVVAAAIVWLCAGVAAAGLLRRASHWERLAGSAHAARGEALALLAIPDEPDALAAELATLERALAAMDQARPPADAALQLAQLLQAWPATVPSKPQSLSIGEGGVSASVTLEHDPAAFLNAFKTPPGWILEEPRLNAAGSLTRLTLSLRAADAPKGATPP